MNNIATRVTIEKIFKNYSFKTKKRLGQNFLINKKIVASIIKELVLNEEVGVIEIGPGLGALTEELLKKAKKVVAIEVDKNIEKILIENFNKKENFKLIIEDFLKIDLDKLIKKEFEDFKKIIIISNLPYYITTNIIIKILEANNTKIKELVLMMQKEVGEKLIRKEDKIESYLKYLLDSLTLKEALLYVSKNDFFPRPKVNSIVLKISINKIITLKEKEFVKKAFTNKRKTLINNFKENYNLKEILSKLNLKENIRIEELNKIDIKNITDLL